MDLLEEIVRTDEKQRYSFNEEHTLIRANQGHSIPVDVELEEKISPDILWHGTGEKYVSFINEQGLIPKSRLYVLLSSDMETARKVGSRHGKPQEDENGVCNRDKISSRQKIVRRVATTDKSRSYEKCLWMCIITRSQSAA